MTSKKEGVIIVTVFKVSPQETRVITIKDIRGDATVKFESVKSGSLKEVYRFGVKNEITAIEYHTAKQEAVRMIVSLF